MGKFTQGSVQSQALIDKEQLARPDVPVQQAPQGEAQPSSNPFAELATSPPPRQEVAGDPAAAPEGLTAGIGEVIGEQVELARQEQAVPGERLQQVRQQQAGEGQLPVDEWRPAKVSSQPDIDTADGGIESRAKDMAKRAFDGSLMPSVYHTSMKEGLEPGQAVAEAIRQGDGKTDSIVAAMHGMDGVVYNQQLGKSVPDPKLVALGSFITEDFFSDALHGDTDLEAELAFGRLEGKTDDEIISGLDVLTDEDKKRNAKFPKSQGNARLGQRINEYYQRNKGVENPPKLPAEEATVVGDAFKEMWYEANKDAGLVTRARDGDQVYYQITPKGMDAFAQGAELRKVVLPKQNVRPAKTPRSRTGKLPGYTGDRVARKVSGEVGDTKWRNSITDEAMNNLGDVANRVDPQRLKVLYSTLLPVLAADPSTYGDDNWRADINNVGGKHWTSFTAKDPATAAKNMSQLRNKVAQEVRAIAQERKSANFLTYYMQAYNGRIAPQQTYFDPTSSKAVRFVTTNAIPARFKTGQNTRIEKNLRQMYAMSLVKDADTKLPHERELALEAASGQLEEWGLRLASALAMTDEQVELVSEAINQGISLNDKKFPQFDGLNLDPNNPQDADLITAIRKKGEDGPHFIDGLIDFAKYQQAKRAGKDFGSFFNAYMDGKTNGIASNGIQMGDEKTALRTGVIRTQDQTLLDDDMDIRDELQSIVLSDLETNGLNADPEINLPLTTVAERVFTIRDLHKATTMTFGYGKDINNFKGDITKYMTEAVEAARNLPNPEPADIAFVQAFEEVANKIGPEKMSENLLNLYGPSIEAALSSDAVNSRSLMRSSAMMHSLMNRIMSIDTAIGTQLNLGRSETLGAEQSKKSEYAIKSDGQTQRHTTYQYATKETAAAKRGDNPGGYAYGGSVPAPVQAIDAMTVAKTASGKSWDRLKQNSQGSPYLHTIYDAFKVDAMGYDVVLEEVNENWLNTAMDWSYLEATHSATRRAYKRFNEETGDNPNRPLSKQSMQYPVWLLEKTPDTNNNLQHNALKRQLSGVLHWPAGMDMKQKYAIIDKKVADIKKDLKNHKHGFSMDSIPEQMTVGNLKAIIEVMRKNLEIDKRFSSAIAKTNAKKKKLREKIKKNGYKAPSGRTIALQYYSH